MDLDLWKITTIIASAVLVITILNNPIITGAFFFGRPVIELFVMSQCPYGVAAEQMMYYLVDAFGNSIDFRINFIANYNNGVFSSLHGQPEVNEDLRQVCAMNHYPNDYYNYMLCYDYEYSACGEDYSACSSEGGSDCAGQYSSCLQSIDWESCAIQTGLNVQTITNCYQGVEGEQLLANNIQRSAELEIGASPSIVFNGEEIDRSYIWDLESMKNLICEDYPGLSGCSVDLSFGSSGSVSGNC